MSRITYLIAFFAALFAFNLAAAAPAEAGHRYSSYTTTHKVVTKHCHTKVSYVKKRHYRKACHWHCYKTHAKPRRHKVVHKHVHKHVVKVVYATPGEWTTYAHPLPNPPSCSKVVYSYIPGSSHYYYH